MKVRKTGGDGKGGKEDIWKARGLIKRTAEGGTTRTQGAWALEVGPEKRKAIGREEADFAM